MDLSDFTQISEINPEEAAAVTRMVYRRFDGADAELVLQVVGLLPAPVKLLVCAQCGNEYKRRPKKASLCNPCLNARYKSV